MNDERDESGEPDDLDADEIEPEDHMAYCSACNGSGEGRADGTRCSTCKGRGEVWID